MKPIYKPKGRAEEYCDYAINIYTGCTHGCVYCYAAKMHHRYHPDQPFNENVHVRDGLIEALDKQLQSGKYEGKMIHLCFACDPYPESFIKDKTLEFNPNSIEWIDTMPTREAIKLLKAAGCRVQILTKGGIDAARDLDLLDCNDSFGVSISCNTIMASNIEPEAMSPYVRLLILDKAKELGIPTWVSCEPVYEPEAIYTLITKYNDSIDFYKIGKLNHYPSDINWKEFGNKCVELLEARGLKYYIKADLKKEMEA